MDADVIDALRLGGAPEEVIEQAIAQMDAPTIEDDDVEVWPENWPTFLFFCAQQSRWNWLAIPKKDGATLLRRTGLNWPSVEIAIDYAIRRGDFKSKNRTALYDDVAMLELEALKVFSDQE